MKEIAQKNLALVAPREVTDQQPKEYLSETFYLFTDDDDWYSPDLPKALANVPAGTHDGITWGNVMLGPWRKGVAEPILDEPEPVHFRPLTVSCHSNNYALTGDYLKRTKKAWKKVFSHGHADEVFATLPVASIPLYLSIKNTNPASTVFLENGLLHEFSSRRLRELIVQYNARFGVGRSLDDSRLRWARSSIVAVRNFFESLAASAR